MRQLVCKTFLLDTKFCFTIDESELCHNVVKFQNITTVIVLLMIRVKKESFQQRSKSVIQSYESKTESFRFKRKPIESEDQSRRNYFQISVMLGVSKETWELFMEKILGWYLAGSVLPQMSIYISRIPSPHFSYRLTENYRNRCCLLTLCELIVRTPNLEVAKKRLLHQYKKASR